MPVGSSSKAAWYEVARFRKGMLLLFVIVLIIEGIVCVAARENDYVVLLRAGQDFLAGDPHASNQDHYMLGRLMFNALPALLPYYVGRALCYVLAILAGILCAVTWGQMADRRWGSHPTHSFAAAAFAVLVLYPYIIRDLDDAGPHLTLLAMLSLGAWSADRSRDVHSGFWLAMAAAFKSTGLLFLPFVLYKRRWKLALSMAAFLVVINVLVPAVYLGWDTTVRANRRFFDKAVLSFTTSDPTQNVREPARHQNQNLATGIARYLQTYPPTHELYLSHPLFIQFGALGLHSAGLTVKCILALMGIVIAWRLRHRWRSAPEENTLPAEWAAVGVLSALLSPLCWLHHLVVMLPAIYLEFRCLLWRRSAGVPHPRWRTLLLAVIAFIVLLLQRDVVQHELSVLLLSYKVNTCAALLSVLLVLMLPKRADATAQVRTDPVRQAA